jgi:hypothetical protein
MRRLWTEDEEAKLREVYPNINISIEEICELLNRNKNTVHLKANELGLDRSLIKRITLDKARRKYAKLRVGPKNSFFGKRHKPETIDNIKRKLHGKFLGVKNPFYGKKHSKEAREKMRAMKKGRYCGADNPAWRGGYEPYYDPNWEEQRRTALERDNYTCQKCGSPQKGREHDVHHIIPFHKFGLERYLEANSLNNLITLCLNCHRKELV